MLNQKNNLSNILMIIAIIQKPKEIAILVFIKSMTKNPIRINKLYVVLKCHLMKMIIKKKKHCWNKELIQIIPYYARYIIILKLRKTIFVHHIILILFVLNGIIKILKVNYIKKIEFQMKHNQKNIFLNQKFGI